MSAAPLHERLAHLAETFQAKAWEEDTTREDLRMFLRDHAYSLSEFARQCQEEYAPLTTDGDVPTNAQGIALARFLRPHFRTGVTHVANVARGGAGLPDDYLHVVFRDGYEGGIDREGRVST